jgi:ribosome-associated protein
MKRNLLMPETSKRTEKKRERDAAEEVAPTSGGEGAGAAPEEVQLEEAALDERMLLALHAASDKKAHDLVALDLRAVASFTDYFLIASGTNARQVQAVADEVVERVRKGAGFKPARVEGYQTGEWVLLDYGDFILHVLEDKARRFYDLERLWRDAARVPLPPELSSGEGGGGPAEGSLRTER